MSVNLVVEKRLGKAGIMVASCLITKCILLVFFGMWFVIVLWVQLFVSLYLIFDLWQGR